MLELYCQSDFVKFLQEMKYDVDDKIAEII